MCSHFRLSVDEQWQNNHSHDHPFLAIGWSSNTSPINPRLKLLHSCSQSVSSNSLKYRVLYTDECFWFLQHDQDSANGRLYASGGIMVSQQQPTVFAMLLFVGHLAQQHANTTQSLSLTLAFWGSFHNMVMNKSPPESLPHQPRMGPPPGQGSTGSVRVGCIENVDAAVKLLEDADDPDSAVQRLQYELDSTSCFHCKAILYPDQWRLEQLQGPQVQDCLSLL